MFCSVILVYGVLLYLFFVSICFFLELKELTIAMLVGIHKWFICCCLRVGIDPTEFLFLILPLASLVIVLVVIVLYLARKQDTIRHKEVETLNELMQTGVMNKDNFYMMLQDLARNKMIEQDSCKALGKLLQESFNENEETVSTS
jgi:hypothetical protein